MKNQDNRLKETITHIAVADIVESKTNPRSVADKDGLKELAASISQGGVRVPLIVRVVMRPLGKEGSVGAHFSKDVYELVDGSRRLAAAKLAELKSVPTIVRVLNDVQAREEQIIANLFREDVHPVDESHAFKALIATMNDIKAVAARVGKPEAYVKRRVSLVQLCKEGVEAFRGGKINEGHAELIAPLSPEGDQQRAVKYVIDDSRYGSPTKVKELADWIEREFSTFLGRQPWVGNAEAEKAVGPCKECPTNHDTLFGSAKVGECVAVKCWQRKMGLYVKHVAAKNGGATLISESWEKKAGILNSHQYELAGKKKCGHTVKAVYADGTKAGGLITVCMTQACKTHHKYSNSSLPLTPAEKAKKKAEKEKKRKAEELAAKKGREAVDAALANVSWPPSVAEVSVLLDEKLESYVDQDTLAAVLIRRGVEIPKERNEHTSDAHTAAVKKVFEAADAKGKWRIVLEILIGEMGADDRKAAVKKLAATPPQAETEEAGEETGE